MRIDMIGIFTDDMEGMKKFYTEVLGFEIIVDMGKYVEFKNEGVRFSIGDRSLIEQITGRTMKGNGFELAFRANSPADVDVRFKELVAKGATSVKEPQDHPWGQRTGFFADSDGNVHEVFADLK